MDKTTRKKIQMRCRKMIPRKYSVPDKGSVYKDDDFEIKCLDHSFFFGDTEMKFEVKDLKTGIMYDVMLTEYITDERPYWKIAKRRNEEWSMKLCK